MSELVIRQLNKSIAIFSIPFSRFGVPLGGRSTAIALQDGKVFVVVSTPLDEPTKTMIDSMGTVSYLLTPDYVHAMHISDFHKAYPAAKCIGPEGIEEKKTDVKWEGVMGKGGGESKIYGFEDEIALHYIPAHRNLEIATFHKPTRTLIVADLLFNLPATEQYSKSKSTASLPWPLNRFYQGMKPGNMPWAINGVISDSAGMAKSKEVVSAWNPEVLIPCHGEVIETGAKAAWDANFAQFK